MELWPESKPPLRGRDFGATLFVYACMCGLGWAVARYGLPYDLMAEQRTRGSARYLPLAYIVAWVGIAGALVFSGSRVVEAILDRRPALPYALFAFALIAEAWLVGFVVAMVAISY
ncbi:hypothetical protein [Nocardia thraciensis]